MIHIGATVRGIRIIMVIIGRIIIIIIGVETGMGITMEIIITDIITTNTITATNAIGTVAEAIEETEILIVQITMLMDIQMESLIL